MLSVVSTAITMWYQADTSLNNLFVCLKDVAPPPINNLSDEFILQEKEPESVEVEVPASKKIWVEPIFALFVQKDIVNFCLSPPLALVLVNLGVSPGLNLRELLIS